MPAFESEIKEAEEEGIVIHPGWGLQEIRGEGGRVSDVGLVGCTSVFDQSGSFNPAFDLSAKKYIEADEVILAIGQVPELSSLLPGSGISLTQQGTIKVNQESLETEVRGVFAGGEVSTGPSSAVEAMALGRKAASSIDVFLGGSGLQDSTARPVFTAQERARPWLGQEAGFSVKARVSVPTLPLSERFRSFQLIRKEYREEAAQVEAGRCLRCNLRFELSPVTLPPADWLEFTQENIDRVPEGEGVFQLLDEKKGIIYIAGTPYLRQSLREQLSLRQEARYFTAEEDPMYTKRESELIQKFLQMHGHLPPGNEEAEDLF